MQSFTKRKRNRIPLNFLSGQKGQKKRYRFTREKATVCLPNVPNTTTSSIPPATDLPPDDHVYHQEDDNDDDATVSMHTRRKEKLAEKWNTLRSGAYKKMIQMYALPPSNKCAICSSEDADVRCQQCGPLLTCQSCCFDIHSKLHYHHFPELWQVQMYIIIKWSLYQYISTG